MLFADTRRAIGLVSSWSAVDVCADSNATQTENKTNTANGRQQKQKAVRWSPKLLRRTSNKHCDQTL